MFSRLSNSPTIITVSLYRNKLDKIQIWTNKLNELTLSLGLWLIFPSTGET